ncbi:MAG: DUF885 domain-containing protein [Armatimonadetes bacterium]|nr:DUF885 domain-containing protein [Armatimonadota bacterium]
MFNFPEWATDVGFPGMDDRWTDNSIGAIEQRKREVELPLRALEAINRNALNPQDQLSYDLFRYNLLSEQQGNAFPGELMPITQLSGIHQEAPQMLSDMPTGQPYQVEAILARLKALPVAVDQAIELMKIGLEKGITPPKITLRDIPEQVSNLIPDNPLQSPLLEAFVTLPPTIPADQAAAFRKQAATIYQDDVVPAFRRLWDFLTNKYIPNARTTIGMNSLPNGAAWYALRARQETTTTMTPQQIHELGLREVKRIRSEMEKLISEVKFSGGFQEFIRFLRSDPRFFYTDSAALLQGYRDIAKRADPELIRLFGRLPRLPYGVTAIPSYAAKSQTTAYYNPGSLKAGRPGYFYANTYNLAARLKWEMEALTLHEAVPGHHLQIAIAQELEGLPEFRREGQYTAYVEGWGLYAESLGYEMGFYQDPYSRFGQLMYEMWRAIRLVVDTGIHSMGWTREQAIAYFMENSGKSEHDITVEVDRYIVWPGQALTYKVGQLKIAELRANAQRELGPQFNIRAFHDYLLGAGALPLDLLETRMQQWVASAKTGRGTTDAVQSAPVQLTPMPMDR